jgi:hypothetical protein
VQLQAVVSWRWRLEVKDFSYIFLSTERSIVYNISTHHVRKKCILPGSSQLVHGYIILIKLVTYISGYRDVCKININILAGVTVCA